MALIKSQDVSRHYGEDNTLVKALEMVDLEIEKGETIAFFRTVRLGINYLTKYNRSNSSRLLENWANGLARCNISSRVLI